MFNGPDVFVFDAEHVDDGGVFIEIDLLHLGDFFFELLDGLLNVVEVLDLFLDGIFLIFEHFEDFIWGVEGDEVVFDLV